MQRALLNTVAPIIAGLVIAASPVEAQTPEQKGRAVAEEADRQDFGWHDNASIMRMVLRNRSGQESVRELRRRALESTEKERGDKSIIIFESPRDIQGTALLSHTRILEPDDQWLYLPALKRVKRISSGNKSGPFVGSEFAYEDLVSQEVDKYEYRWLRDEQCGDLECAVVERYPRYENSGYTRQIVWWDKEEYRVQKIEYYDRKDALLKTLTYHDYKEYEGEYWRPDRMAMVNHQNGKSTDLVFEEWTFGAGVSDNEFTASRLRRAR
ncbi:MAG: outer membrane lipoprotein-sorting protein [Gemmatimonadetes bacterium]|nr:outer membrane lipoprotein-sorting protein [Gemmatimonadota bacterium]